jgi:hypothetical protein
MKRLYCKFEKVGEIAIRSILGFVYLAPVVGIFIAIPVIAISIYLFGTPPSKTCSL